MRDKLQQSSTCLFVLINYKNAFCSSSLPQHTTLSLKKHTNLFHKLTCHVSYVNIISPSIIFVNISNYVPILKPTFYALVVIKIAWLLPSLIILHEMFLTWLVHCLVKKKSLRSSLFERFHLLMKEYYTLGFDDQPVEVCKQYKSTNMLISVTHKKQKASAAMLNPY